MIVPDTKLSISRQCELTSLNRSTLYYRSKPMSKENIALIAQEFCMSTYRRAVANEGISSYIEKYTSRRPHTRHGIATPDEAYGEAA